MSLCERSGPHVTIVTCPYVTIVTGLHVTVFKKGHVPSHIYHVIIGRRKHKEIYL